MIGFINEQSYPINGKIKGYEIGTKIINEKESKKYFKQEGYSIDKINKLEELLCKAYGIYSNRVNPNGATAIASGKDNLISTATIFCLINGDWSKSMQLASEIFSLASQKDLTLEKSRKSNKNKN